MEIYERVKELRSKLHLSQDYVAKYLGVSRATVTQMENGKRKILADDISRLSILFGLSPNDILGESEISEPATVFARSFDKLDENDQAEIMNLIRFKEQMKAHRTK